MSWRSGPLPSVAFPTPPSSYSPQLQVAPTKTGWLAAQVLWDFVLFLFYQAQRVLSWAMSQLYPLVGGQEEGWGQFLKG